MRGSPIFQRNKQNPSSQCVSPFLRALNLSNRNSSESVTGSETNSLPVEWRWSARTIDLCRLPTALCGEEFKKGGGAGFPIIQNQTPRRPERPAHLLHGLAIGPSTPPENISLPQPINMYCL